MAAAAGEVVNAATAPHALRGAPAPFTTDSAASSATAAAAPDDWIGFVLGEVVNVLAAPAAAHVAPDGTHARDGAAAPPVAAAAHASGADPRMPETCLGTPQDSGSIQRPRGNQPISRVPAAAAAAAEGRVAAVAARVSVIVVRMA